MMVSGSQFLASRSKLKVRKCPYYCGRSQTSSKVWPSQFPISHLRTALLSHLLQLPPRQIKHNAPRKKRLSADCHKYRDKLRSTLTTTKIKSFTKKLFFIILHQICTSVPDKKYEHLHKFLYNIRTNMCHK